VHVDCGEARRLEDVKKSPPRYWGHKTVNPGDFPFTTLLQNCAERQRAICMPVTVQFRAKAARRRWWHDRYGQRDVLWAYVLAFATIILVAFAAFYFFD
jgi:hypothetical protein